MYAVGRPDLTPAGRFMAAVLACGPGAALSHRSAASLWGMYGAGSGPVHVTAPGQRGRRDAAIRVHRSQLAPDERRVRERIPLTSPARTLIDLADTERRRVVERAMDEAEHLRLDCTGLSPRHGRRGSGMLASILADHHPGSTRTRSALEELVLELCAEHGLPRLEVNAPVEGYEVDFVWRRQRLVVESAVAAQLGRLLRPSRHRAAPASRRRP